MKKDKYNKFLRPLAYTMLFFAATHIAVLIFLVVTRFDFHYINVFYILGLNELMPNNDKGTASFLVSTAIILIVYSVVNAISKDKN